MKKCYFILCFMLAGGLRAQCPDLKITSASILSFSDDHIRYALNLANAGNVDALLDNDPGSLSDNVVIHAFLSQDERIDSGDHRSQDIILGLNNLVKINAGEVFSIVSRDSLLNGAYHFLILRVDPFNKLPECNEENNVFILRIKATALTLEVPMLEAPAGTQVEIPVYGSDFYRILGFQFSVSFSKISMLRIDSIGKLGLTEMIRDDIRIKDNSIGALWFSNQTEGLSFNGKRRLFSIFVTLTGNPGTCSEINFDHSYLPIEFISTNPLNEPVGVKTIHGKICIQNHVECSGRITLSDQRPISQVLVKANEQKTYTDHNGKYLFKQLNPGTTYTFSAEKTDAFVTGLSIIDIILIKKHILEIQLLLTPYEIIAADVNGDLTLSVQDIVLIRNLILGMIPHFGKTPVWQFIPKSYVFKNPKKPLLENYPISYTIPNINTDKSGIDFIGIKTGDVSLDWLDKAGARQPESREARAIAFVLEDQMLEAGQEYIVPIRSRQFKDIHGFQLAWRINPNVTIHKISSSTLPDFNSQNYHVNEHELRLLWYPQNNREGQTIQDQDTLLLVYIKVQKALRVKELFVLHESIIPAEVSQGKNKVYGVQMEYTSPPINRSIGSTLELEIYPNPFHVHFTIRLEMPRKDQLQVRVHDIQGRLIWQDQHMREAGLQEIRINAESWPEGVYSVSANSTFQIYRNKRVVCHH